MYEPTQLKRRPTAVIFQSQSYAQILSNGAQLVVCATTNSTKITTIFTPKMSAADDDAQLASAQRFLDHLHANGRQSPSDIDCRFEMALPAWYDHRKFQRGQQLCAQNTYALFMSTIVGGLSLLALPSIRAVLRSTGQSDTAQLNYRRYQKTMLYAMLWTREPLEPGSRSWRSLESVRKRHVLVSRRTAAAANGEGMRITQTDMSLVLYAIVG